MVEEGFRASSLADHPRDVGLANALELDRMTSGRTADAEAELDARASPLPVRVLDSRVPDMP